MISLAIAIMAHPSRHEGVGELVKKLAPAQPMVVWDPDPDGEPSAWRTARAAWRQLGQQRRASHALLLQDDVTVCRDLKQGLERALRRRPNECVAPYANNQAIEKARDRGFAWASIPGGTWGQAICLPKPWIPGFLEFAETDFPCRRYSRAPVRELGEGNDDRRVACFLDAHDKTAWATVPSLVDHTHAGDSLLGHSNKTRVARWYIGDDESALSVDWSKGAGLKEVTSG